MVARESAAKKTAAKKTTHKAAEAKKVPGEAAPAKKTAARAAPAKKAVAKKTAAKKAPAKKAAEAEGAATSEGTAQSEATARVEEPGRAPEAASASQKAKPARKQTAAKKTTGAKTVAAKKTPAAAKAEAVPPARNAGEPVPPGELAVRPGEDPWTADEVEEARAGLHAEVERLRAEITSSEEALNGLMRDSGDGAGDDDADTGTKNITREHEMSLAANAREMLYQTERALERLDAGTYGLCENCGKPIGKARMQAFPRATLCVECKQKQERR
ncbi:MULTISPECIES: TraR/DksA C4-type zinc finger protein [unclassified Streptomyces]|uniref:TraR/DksA family transcriptional regulator n=1 Tax=unclassified Streptomyces TaxID=2593676 RepID=UPI002DD9CF43|nr:MULTISPECIES: TraR/DksA C4-type zinc finger protein [unclassified Streptomyces]WSA95340.1 TraR/DksA C4-type zinc finger protein [Streptomyces sp. NBC_01795]WSB79758.1 TraR/DksA C4-type zinc finger protein [Streptomyces sp. NBC_01775]WSS12035.1 TraR/DksA C4-type zinc finger protein [Streptomyces sp. NBC_01186]WSS40749.1 TraR/DksA C4-type zinc finger protein [Streptomyces sp. NBC_01187]